MKLWFFNALLVLVTLLALLRPLFAKPRGADLGEPDDPDGALLADRLGELEHERTAGLVSDDEYARARRETELAYGARDRGVRHAVPRTPVVAALLVVVVTVAMAGGHLVFSDSHRMVLVQQRAASIVEELVVAADELERYLAGHPEDEKARLRLAETRYVLGDHVAAAAAYRLADEAGAIIDDRTWINYADALARGGGVTREREAGGGMAGSGHVLAMLERMLATDPGHRRALLLSGLLGFERGEYSRAIGYWQRLLGLLPEDEAVARGELRTLIERARSRAGAGDTTGGEAADAGTIVVMVSLSGELRAGPGDTVFVYARAIDGPPMPLAIARLTVADLPARVVLGDEDAMMAGLGLGTFEQVEIVARVSKRGQAAPVAGDLIGVVSPVRVGATVDVEISELVE